MEPETPSASKEERLIVIGRFPPPIDGQSMLTKRFVSLVDGSFDVIRINTNIRADASALSKIGHYIRLGMVIGRTVRRHPESVVVWQSISPRPLGHLRDLVTVVRHIRNCASVAVVHWGKFHTVFQGLPTRWTAGWLIRSLNRIVFNTHSLSNVCSEWIPDEKRIVIQNSVDAETLCTEEEVADKVQKGPGDPFRVLFLSNMFKEKGYLDVLEAAVRLNREGRNMAFDFVGAWQSGADRKEFEDIVKREHLSDVVQHHGAVSDRNEVKRFHLSADAFALPSYHFAEAQPMSVVEALSAGTPVIVSDAGGIGDMFRDGEEALYVPVRNPDAVRDAVVRLMDETTWTTTSLHARKLFLETYHPDVVRRRWIDLLTALRPAAEEPD